MKTEKEIYFSDYASLDEDYSMEELVAIYHRIYEDVEKDCSGSSQSNK